MCRHIYDWNIVNCDVKLTIQLNSTQLLVKVMYAFQFRERKRRQLSLCGSHNLHEPQIRLLWTSIYRPSGGRILKNNEIVKPLKTTNPIHEALMYAKYTKKTMTAMCVKSIPFWPKGLVIGPSEALYTSFLERCTLINKAVVTIWRDLSKRPQMRQVHVPVPSDC